MNRLVDMPFTTELNKLISGGDKRVDNERMISEQIGLLVNLRLRVSFNVLPHRFSLRFQGVQESIVRPHPHLQPVLKDTLRILFTVSSELAQKNSRVRACMTNLSCYVPKNIKTF